MTTHRFTKLTLGTACAALALTFTACAPVAPDNGLPTADDGSQLAAPMSTAMTAAYSKAITTPCVTEDSSNCYWSADIMGNGSGRSYIDVLGKAYYH